MGWSFDTTDGPSAALGSLPRVLLFVFVCACCTFVLHFIIIKLFGWLDRARDKQIDPSSVLPMGTAMRRWFTSAFLPMFFLWGAWWLIHFPGALDDDTLTQMLQSSGLQDWSDHHPVFDTWLFGRVWAFGDLIGSRNIALGAFTGLQTLATAITMALLFVYLRRLGVPSRLVTTMQVLFTLTPLIPMYAMSMTKDYLHNWILVLFCLLFAELIRTRGSLLLQPNASVSLCILSILLALTKKTGLYILVGCLIGALVVCAFKRGRIALVLGAPLLALTLFSSLVLPALGVSSGSRAEMLSIPLQQTARVLRDNSSDVTTDERRIIYAVLDEDIATLYTPRRSDAVKNTWNQSATRAEKLEYLRVWFSLGIRHPGTFTSAFLNMTYDYLYPVPLDDLYDEVSPHLFTEQWTDYLYSQTKPGTERSQVAEQLSGIHASDRFELARQTWNNMWDTIRHAPAIGIIFTGAPYVGWLPLIVFCYLVRTRNASALAAMIPVVAVILALYVGPIALPRYISSAIYLSPLTAGLPFLRAKAPVRS